MAIWRRKKLNPGPDLALHLSEKLPCREPVFTLDKKYGIVQDVRIEHLIDWDTHGAAERWLILLNSGKYADTLSLDPRLEPGTDFEGSVSELI